RTRRGAREDRHPRRNTPGRRPRRLPEGRGGDPKAPLASGGVDARRACGGSTPTRRLAYLKRIPRIFSGESMVGGVDTSDSPAAALRRLPSGPFVLTAPQGGRAS